MDSTMEARSVVLRHVFNWVIPSAAALATCLVCLVLMEVYKAQLVYQYYKRRSNGLPMLGDRSLISNHTITICLRRNVIPYMMAFQEKIGRKTYGLVVRNLLMVVTSDPELMKRIVLDDPNKNINKANLHMPADELSEDSIMVAGGEQWRRLRRAVGPALKSSKFKSPNTISEFEASASGLIEAIEDKLTGSEEAKKEGITLELDDMVERYTLDLMFRCLYKKYDFIDFKADHCETAIIARTNLADIMSNVIFNIAISIHAFNRPLDWIALHCLKVNAWRRLIMDFIRDQTNLSREARKQLKELKARGEKVNPDDFMLKDGTRFQRNIADYIADHLLDDKINRREHFNTMNFVVNAGYKTSSDTIIDILYNLSIYSDIQEKLRKSIQVEGINSEYLGWVINESLRLMPPAPGAFSRVLEEDMEIEDGRILPKGCFVCFLSPIAHRLKEYWGEDATEFRPERFAKEHEFHPLQYAPFGYGIRSCPGREFALYEIRDLLSKLLLRYRFHCSVKPDADEYDAPFFIFTLKRSPTYIRVTRI